MQFSAENVSQGDFACSDVALLRKLLLARGFLENDPLMDFEGVNTAWIAAALKQSQQNRSENDVFDEKSAMFYEIIRENNKC